MRVRTFKNKEACRKWAKKEGRTVLWRSRDGVWHAALDKRNTPKCGYAVETEDV